MSIQYEKSEFDRFENGKIINKVQCQVSSTAELSTLEVADGSLAYNKRTGDVYSYDGGSWYNSDGSGVVNA